MKKQKQPQHRYRPRTEWAIHPSFPRALKAEDGTILRCPSGEICPEHLRDIFADELLQQTGTLIRSYITMMRRLRASWNPFIQPVVIELLEELESMFKGMVPWGLCSECDGKGDLDGVGCPHCMAQGFIPLVLREYHL